MDEQTSKLIAELRAAESKRTPGEWEYGISGYTWNVHKASDKYTVASVPYSRIFDDDMALKEQNAAYIALCSRAVPVLLAALDGVTAERDALRAVLDSQSLKERLAALEHERWSGWMHYMFNRTTFNDDGTWTMPAWAVERWTRQMNTPYAELTEREKDSDRAEADKTLAVIQAALAPTPQPPAPPSVDWRADCVRWLQGDGHRYVAFQIIMMLDNLNVAGAAWDDAAENIVVVIFVDKVTTAEIENAKLAVEAYKLIRQMDSAYALLITPEAQPPTVADDVVAVARWTGERVERV